MVDIPSGIGTTAFYTLGASRLDQLEVNSDDDWFRVSLTAGTRYGFAVTGTPVAGRQALFDSTLSIRNSNGAELAFNDDGSTGRNSFISFTAPYTGNYYLVVASYDASYNGGYELLGTQVIGGDDLPGDTTTSRQLVLDQPFNARIESAFDEDAVFIELSARSVYRLQVRGVGAGLGLTLPDPYLVIANSSGTIIAENDDRGATDFEAELLFTAPTTGRYYIGAFDVTGGTGTYQFFATLVSTPPQPATGLNRVGTAAADSLEGGAGNDTLDGRGGNDQLLGLGGDDLYFVDSEGDLTFEFPGGGTDAVVATTSVYLWPEIEGGSLATAAGAAFLVGNASDNALAGNDFDNRLLGVGGNDTLRGNGGNDALFGGDGDDQLLGGAGIDYLAAGDGGDTLDGEAGADALYGEAGDDSLSGGGSFDTDILVGGIGGDTLDGASGLGDYDLMDGGAGDDDYLVDTPDDLTFEAAAGGTDTVYASISGAGYYLYPHIERLVLLGGTPFGVGNDLANQLTGSDQANWLLGGAGDDTITGNGGADVLFGEAGRDLFVATPGMGGDVIGDFVTGSDRVDVTAFGFGSFVNIRANMVEVAGTAALNLGNGDFLVFNGIARAAFSAADFVI